MRMWPAILLSLAFAVAPQAWLHADSATVEPAVNAEDLDREISKTLTRPEYAWRLPRDRDQADAGVSTFWETLAGWMRNVAGQIRDALRRLFEWFADFFETPDHDHAYDFDWWKGIQTLLFLLLAATSCTLGILLYRTWKNRRNKAVLATVTEPDMPLDLHDESVTASQLPPNEWLAFARELLDRGERRLALRALFLGALAHLASRGLLTIAVYKSNREYLDELLRRAHDQPLLLQAFRVCMRLLESVWYGTNEATVTLVETFLGHHDTIVDGSPLSPPPPPGQTGGPS